jgi:hypothetical protein
VRTLSADQVDSATRTIPFDGRDMRGRLLASGVYFYRVHTRDGSITRKMVIQR